MYLRLDKTATFANNGMEEDLMQRRTSTSTSTQVTIDKVPAVVLLAITFAFLSLSLEHSSSSILTNSPHSSSNRLVLGWLS